ncbi:MAG: prepilin-type N-terminal cleavage/methylation domain-containing protein [Verrucomicrobiia bacterium]
MIQSSQIPLKRPRRDFGKPRGFTLPELIAAVSIVLVVILVVIPGIQSVRQAAWKAVSIHSLRSLSIMGGAYRAENNQEFWKYRQVTPDGVLWWFGLEPRSSIGRPEGERFLDLEKGPLGPYAIAAGGWKSDPAFLAAGRRLKQKFRNGIYGYGYNTHLGGGPTGGGAVLRSTSFNRPSEIIVFATAGQVNTFQAPASSRNPMLEDIQLVNSFETTFHFRHGGKALAVMMDGSMREFEMAPGTKDLRLPSANVGRITPRGSTRHFLEELDPSE